MDKVREQGAVPAGWPLGSACHMPRGRQGRVSDRVWRNSVPGGRAGRLLHTGTTAGLCTLAPRGDHAPGGHIANHTGGGAHGIVPVWVPVAEACVDLGEPGRLLGATRPARALHSLRTQHEARVPRDEGGQAQRGRPKACCVAPRIHAGSFAVSDRPTAHGGRGVDWGHAMLRRWAWMSQGPQADRQYWTSSRVRGLGNPVRVLYFYKDGKE